MADLKCEKCGSAVASCPAYQASPGDIVLCLRCGEVHRVDKKLCLTRCDSADTIRQNVRIQHLQYEIWRKN